MEISCLHFADYNLLFPKANYEHYYIRGGFLFSL